MASFIWFCIGFVVAAIFGALLLVLIAACACMPDLPLFLMSHSTLQSLECYKKEHPWSYRWWSFVAWLEEKILGDKGNSLP